MAKVQAGLSSKRTLTMIFVKIRRHGGAANTAQIGENLRRIPF